MLFKSVLLITLSIFFMKQNNDGIEEIRVEYIKAVENQDTAEKMLKKLSDSPNLSPLFLAYRGAFEGLMAKHVFNPYKKLSFLSLSNRTLARAVAQKPNSVEIRFLRFSMQHYLPDFLGQSKELKEDRIAICKHIASDDELTEKSREVVCRFMIDSKRCTSQEAEIFRNLLKKQ